MEEYQRVWAVLRRTLPRLMDDHKAQVEKLVEMQLEEVSMELRRQDSGRFRQLVDVEIKLQGLMQEQQTQLKKQFDDHFKITQKQNGAHKTQLEQLEQHRQEHLEQLDEHRREHCHSLAAHAPAQPKKRAKKDWEHLEQLEEHRREVAAPALAQPKKRAKKGQ